jgi:hypothetical protein
MNCSADSAVNVGVTTVSVRRRCERGMPDASVNIALAERQKSGTRGGARHRATDDIAVAKRLLFGTSTCAENASDSLAFFG